jgi:hypothetical protein
LPTWEDAVTNQRLIQAAYRSVAERREVAPEEISPGGVHADQALAAQ